jgi:DNA-binding transcriptional ArsR family regulator
MEEAALLAIVEPHRRAIFDLVRGQELTAGQIASHFTLTRPGVSQHLRILRDAGLLTYRRQGTQRLYRADPEGVAALKGFIEAALG